MKHYNSAEAINIGKFYKQHFVYYIPLFML